MSVQFRLNDGRAVVAVQGNFNFSLIQPFRDATLQAMQADGVNHIEVSLHQTDYLDSSALGMLLVLSEEARAKGIQQLSLTGARASVRKVLEMAKFGKFFTIE